jgi:hypothetical protein
MKPPAWAERVISEVARSSRRSPPEMHWRSTRRRRSAGSACDEPSGEADTISIAAGRDPIDQRLVVCHELAHWLVGPADGHSPRFWRRAWQLYRRFRVPIHYALAREGEYTGAIVAYERSTKRRSVRPAGRS